MSSKPGDRLLDQKDPHFRRIARRTRYGAQIEPREHGDPRPEDGAPLDQDRVRTGSTVRMKQPIMLGLPPNWTVRFQGERGTCVPQAAAACAEYELYRNSIPVIELSAQFIHYKIKEMQRSRKFYSDRDWLYEAAYVLRRDGVCTNADCPYDPALPPNVVGPRPSPDAALKAKGIRFRTTVLDFVRADGSARGDWSGDGPPDKKTSPVDWIVRRLRAGNCVAMTIPVQNMPPGSDGPDNWNTREARMLGRIDDPRGPWYPAPKHFPPAEGHAVCLVGCVPNGSGKPDQFVFRNSWGLDWASEIPSTQPFAVRQVPNRGYGAISAMYVDMYCSELMTLELIDAGLASEVIA